MKKEDIQFMMSTASGRAVMWRMLSFCGVYDQVSGTHDEMLLLEGKRRVGLQVMASIVEQCEDQFFIMMKEAKTKSKEIENEQEIRSREENRNYESGRDFNYGRHFGLDEEDRDESGELFI